MTPSPRAFPLCRAFGKHFFVEAPQGNAVNSMNGVPAWLIPTAKTSEEKGIVKVVREDVKLQLDLGKHAGKNFKPAVTLAIHHLAWNLDACKEVCAKTGELKGRVGSNVVLTRHASPFEVSMGALLHEHKRLIKLLKKKKDDENQETTPAPARPSAQRTEWSKVCKHILG